MPLDNIHAPYRRDDAQSDRCTASALADLLSFEPSSLDAKPEATGAEAVSRFAAAIRARMAGPGGYYNLGNALGLLMGVALHLAAPRGTGTRGGTVLFDYFAGSGSAVALTLATLVFFCSGEVYHRAWAGRDIPDPALNRLGDLLSGIGAIGLGAALFLLGQPVLAATAGGLHALGKFGSATHRPGAYMPGWPAGWPDPFRSAVLASRLPAMLAAVLSVGAALPEVWLGGSCALVAEPLTLLACYLLWARADLLLFTDRASESAPALPTTARLDDA
ncbi:conserved membrane hypothetical protein [Mesorhizobium metallidurans STM 2683]|uniref:Uncharacterized protein n=1 Tax=Mesorhizobium metallidurans STM 2683 TaxID=1297569 RepID=M5F8P3_9HYPH|nr:hypothetical protein [Mesorhizobium metallidurans]CCV08271.1 conserved membrane hypothetical protein [Mesorhizobium metallidurans STM 2683]